MPKAENRKRPPNLKAPAPGRGNLNRFDGQQHTADRQDGMTRKQDLLEKMRAIQKEKHQK